MTFFEDCRGERSYSTSPERIAFLRKILDTHANDPSNGRCRVCDQPTCLDWQRAYDQLAAAGQLMAEPERWLGPAGRGERR